MIQPVLLSFTSPTCRSRLFSFLSVFLDSTRSTDWECRWFTTEIGCSASKVDTSDSNIFSTDSSAMGQQMMSTEPLK